MVEYLVNSIGFPKEEASIVSSKVSTFKSNVNPNSVVDFFETCGLSQTQIKNVISKQPRILFSNVDKTLKPKIQAFKDFGFSAPDIADIVSSRPNLLFGSLDNHNIPTLAGIKSSTWNLKEEIQNAIALLRSYGIPLCQIRKYLVRESGHLIVDPKALEPMLIKVEKLGIPRGSGMFIHGLSALCRLDESTLELRMGLYKSYGFTDKDILTLFGKNPYTLSYSETKLRKSLDFFLKEAGYYPAEMAWNSNVLTYSLQKRVLPRYTVWKCLKERGLQDDIKKRSDNVNDPFLTCIKRSDHEFFKKFVEPFEDRCPDLYSDYMKTTGYVLEVKVTK